MLKDITLGQYYPVDSAIHRLDPRTKLAGTLLYLISLFITSTAAGYIIATAFLGFCIYMSRVPVSYITRGLKAIVVILMLSACINIFFIDGTVLFRLGFIRITYEGLITAAFMGLRLVYLVIGSSLMTLTTTPTQLTDGLEKGLGFLNRFKLPVHDIAMMMSIALRFIPILTDETDKIMKAQKARGADFETGNIFRKAKAMVPILVPLFIAAFRRASDLALAMESRCYHGGSGRTKMKPLKYGPNDRAAYLVLLIYFAAMAASRFLY
ncbi:MAG: energy-coupling factor transporter transmembrane component T [Eubacteriales bacterium]|nr:energy-coupling factor transporter transmembrane component T [Eubacteriales bacterium]